MSRNLLEEDHFLLAMPHCSAGLILKVTTMGTGNCYGSSNFRRALLPQLIAVAVEDGLNYYLLEGLCNTL